MPTTRGKREKLAIHGGPKAKTTPYRTGRRFGRDELRELREALDQNTLFYAHGKKVRQFCTDLAAKYGKKYAVACTSGTLTVYCCLRSDDWDGQSFAHFDAVRLTGARQIVFCKHADQVV